MPEYIKALIVILVLATAIFAVAKQPVSTIIKTKDFTRRRNLWLALAFAAFLTNDFWLYTLIAILLLTFVHRYEANPPALFFFILFALPPGTVPIPGMGIINFIFDLSHVRILELFILLPAFFALNRKSDTAPIGRVVPDKFIVAYLLLTALLNVRDTSVLDALRQAFYLFIGGFLPYFVLSRSLKNLHAFKDTLVSLVLAIMVLGLIAVIETYKHWLLYQPLIDTLKITGTQQYLGRDGMLRAVASAQHPIVLGYLMVVGMGSYLFLKRSIHHKLIRWLGMMLLVAGLISSLSRGPWIGAAVLLLVFVATGRKPARRLTVLVLASVLALPLVAILPGGEKIINLLPFFGTKAVAPINYRENLFTASMIVIQKYPWLGSANFAKTPEMQPLITEGMVDLVNTYVGVALNSGFVGLGLFVGFFASTLSGVYRSMRSILDKDSEEYLLGQALLATQLSIMVIIATTSSISFISILNWAIAGLGVAYSQMVRSGLANSVNSKKQLDRTQWSRTLPVSGARIVTGTAVAWNVLRFKQFAGVNMEKFLFLFSLLAACSENAFAASFPTHLPIGFTDKVTAIRNGIAEVQLEAANMPYLNTQAPYLGASVIHYCDCGSGHAAGCVAGDNSNSGDINHPKQTVEAAMAYIKQSGPAIAGDTVAFCKGGGFDEVSGNLGFGSSRCSAGVICNEIREYDPSLSALPYTFRSNQKPIITVAGNDAFHEEVGPSRSCSTNCGGVRFLNLTIRTTDAVPANIGIWMLADSAGWHDVDIRNVNITGFRIGIISGPSYGTNINIEGNTFTGNKDAAYFGSSNNSSIAYNTFEGNGSYNILTHTLYLGAGPPGVSREEVIGNYIHGQYGSTCSGSPVTVHGEFDGLLIKDNAVLIDASANTGGCWGMDLSNGGWGDPTYFRNTAINGNVFLNGGNLALSVVSCPYCLIENNLIVADGSAAGGDGIRIPAFARRTSPADDVNTNNTVINNTIYYTSSVILGMRGITVETEGTGHIVANNAVYYGGSSSSYQDSCYAFGLPLPSYSFINNNNCYSVYQGAQYKWESHHGFLASWQAYASSYGFDSNSFEGAQNFKLSTTYDYRPNTGSPLIGAGTNLHKSTLDIIRKVRPNPPAIGAYEP